MDQKSRSGNAFDLSLLKRVLRYVRPYRRTFNFTIGLVIMLAVLGAIRPLIIQYIIDETILTPKPNLLLLLTITVIGILILESIIQFFQTYYANWVGQSVIKDIRQEIFHKISGYKLKYFDRTPIGTLVTRVVSDIETIAEIFSQGILVIMGDLLKLIGVITVMFIINWRLALLCLAPIPLLLVATNIFKNAIKRAFQDVRNRVAELNAFVQEHITGMNIVHIFNREKVEMNRFKAINRKHRAAHISTVYANAIFFPVVELFSATAIALLVWFGSKELIVGNAQFGELVAFILYIHMLFRPIRQLADRFNTLQMGIVSSERVFKVIDTNSTIENAGDINADTIKGDIEFKDVWFAYKDEDWVLRGVSFKVKAGQTAAFVGATGAGKTSIINLIARYYEFQKGSITIDGIDVRDYSLSSLRKHVGIVLQDVFLFSDSIRNNATMGNPAITDEALIKASKEVGTHDFISSLVDTYDFDVKERGGVLSVGQRQLISFLRAYLYNPEILILDEATSSIDTESEELIQRATEKLTEKRTSIVIAHRLATIQKADVILVLDKGQVMEQGSHDELLKKDGWYKALYEIQFKKAEKPTP